MKNLDKEIEDISKYLSALRGERACLHESARKAQYETAIARAGSVTGAAKMLGVTRKVAHRAIRKYGITNPRGFGRTAALIRVDAARELVYEVGVCEAAKRLGVNYKSLGRLCKS